MSNPNMMEFMNQQFPTIFKTASGSDGALAPDCVPGQKVVCTPEVSLYQYTSSEGPPISLTKLDGKGIHGIEHSLPPSSMRNSEPGSGGSGAGSTSSTGGFQCGFCGKTFQQKNTFQNHLRSHREGEDPYQCDICGKTFAVPARLTRHYRTHTGEKPYQCEYCNKSFSVKENLSVHRRIHTKERPYKCEVCERAFEHSGKLHRHMRIHTGERPHRCQICQKTFIQSGQLVIHMRTHTGEKPYVCKVCNKGFTCSKQLKVHTRTHTGEKPYTCDICGKSFGYNHVLKLHQVAHYGEKVYKCTLCNGTFNSKKSLETHIKTHSEGSLPNESSSPTHISEPSGMSPSSLSQTPQNSDKENRESSDSEVSSHNSPRVEPPKTPPSPVTFSNSSSRQSQQLNHQPQYKSAIQGPSNEGSIRGGNGNNNLSAYISRDTSNSQSSNNSTNNYTGNGNPKHSPPLPYPMLPPGVQVHQSPQSRTTFLYVTSKLPTHPSMNGPNSSNNPAQLCETDLPPQSRNFNQLLSPTSSTKQSHYNPAISNSPISFKALGGLLSNGSSNGGTSKLSIAPATETPVQRDRLFLANASIRDKKVLPFLEQFGYGLPKDSLINQHGTFNLSRESRNSEREIRQLRDSSTVLSLPENLSTTAANNSFIRANNGPINQDYFRRSPSSERMSRLSSDSRDRSPEIRELPQSQFSASNYTPGGVLALALTRGSKAAMQTGQLCSPLRLQVSTPPRSNTQSPELLDFSSRRSVSPNRNSIASLSPASTPGPSESMDGFADDGYNQKSSDDQEMNNNDIVSVGGKRTRSSSSGGGPRKRSSLILEKYAQENPATPAPPVSNESILSQRLRLSSVIQYAEKCS